MHIYGIHVEIHLLRHRDPAHSAHDGVLTGEINYDHTLDATIPDRAAKRRMRGYQKENCGLSRAGRSGHGIDVSAPNDAIDYVFWRLEVSQPDSALD